MPILGTAHLYKGLTFHVYCTATLYEFKLKAKRFKCRKVKGLDSKLLIIYSVESGAQHTLSSSMCPADTVQADNSSPNDY